MSSGRLDQVWAVLLHYEKMKRGEAKAISSMLNIHYFSIDPSLQTEIVPMIPVSNAHFGTNIYNHPADKIFRMRSI